MSAAPVVVASPTADELITGTRKTTDMGNAERLADLARGRLLWVASLGWLHWDGKRWDRARAGQEMELAKETVRGIYGEASTMQAAAAQTLDDVDRRRLSDHAEDLARWAHKSEGVARVKALVELGHSEKRLVVPQGADALDADPDVLNVQNGILDLGSFELHPHDPDRHLTKITNAAYDPDAGAPFWTDLLALVLPNPEVRDWVKRAAGYSILGQYSEYLFLPYGKGANGKSSMLAGLRDALGDYAGEAAPELLVSRREWGAASDSALASLRGRRLVTTAETEQGKRMAEVLVKQLTGETAITAKFMRQDYFTYRNQAAVWLATNHKPIVQGMDYAIWRRIRLIPFEVTIPPAERLEPSVVQERLRAERDGILTWLIEGLQLYRKHGLHPAPSAVDAATEAYREEMDPLREWLDDECINDPAGFTPYKTLRQSYEMHCTQTGRQPLGATRFQEQLSEQGFEGAKRSGERGRAGVRLRAMAGVLA